MDELVKMPEEQSKTWPPERWNTEKLAAKIARAEDGDTIEAKDLIESLACYLLTSIKTMPNGEILPVPYIARDYLAKALFRISRGEDANVALNIKVPRRPPKWSHSEKLRCADLVSQFVEQDLSVDKSAEIAEKTIQEIKTDIETHPQSPWKKIVNNKVGHSVLKKWYYELKDEPNEFTERRKERRKNISD